jgi:hypothetical protein
MSRENADQEADDDFRRESERMAAATGRPSRLWIVFPTLAFAVSGCRMVPRDQVEECHRLSQTLRTENAQLKDQVLALRSQNQDLSERSVDDVRRLAQLEAANRTLESSVQAYQGERARLESAYKELRASLPGALQALALNRTDEESPPPVPSGAAKPRKPEHDHEPGEPADNSDASAPDSDTASEGKRHQPGAWVPSRSDGKARLIPAHGDP